MATLWMAIKHPNLEFNSCQLAEYLYGTNLPNLAVLALPNLAALWIVRKCPILEILVNRSLTGSESSI